MTAAAPLPNALDLARAMCRHMLGPGRWEAAPNRFSEDRPSRNNWAELVHEDGPSVSLSVGGWHQEGRVVFRGQWPKYDDGRGYWPVRCGDDRDKNEITCDARRSPRELVRELERRLLPVYLPKYRKAVEIVRGEDQAALDALEAASRIARAIGGQVRENKARPGEEVAIYHEPNCVYRLRVKAAYGDKATRVDFEVFGLEVQTAQKVLRLIAEAERRTRT